MGKNVVPNKKEKVQRIFNKNNNIDLESFKSYFKKDYPKDWDNIQKEYKKQVTIPRRNGKKGSSMPPPPQYLENMFNNAKK